MADETRDLTLAVERLAEAVGELDQSLNEYPKRAEIEKRFVSKQQSRRLIAQMVVVALVVVVGCFTLTTGIYALCYTGAENPGICTLSPGFDDRLNRREELDRRERNSELHIQELEDQLAELQELLGQEESRTG